MLPRTAENGTKTDLVRAAMTLPSVVFPTPGGPQRIIDGTRSLSIAFARSFPGATRCAWPT